MMTYFIHKSMMIFVGEVQGHLSAGGFRAPLTGQMFRIPEEIVGTFTEEEPKKPRHHDHLIERHIRSPYHRK